MQHRIVMLVDLDYFFAQCEELRNPSLRDKPVVVYCEKGQRSYYAYRILRQRGFKVLSLSGGRQNYSAVVDTKK